ncbi:MAG TPA: hypothetical protein VF666_16040 [Pyrinomonadaceae bacterium]|jgi:hypothetical protein
MFAKEGFHEFEPLFEAAHPEMYLVNAFRVTGLRVGVSDLEIKRHLKKIEMAARLGQDDGETQGVAARRANGALLPHASPPDHHALQAAQQRLLRDPIGRILDEFFWFWPTTPDGEDASLAALARSEVETATQQWLEAERKSRDAVATHNLAVLFHCRALDIEHDARLRALAAEQTAERDRCWREAYRRWKALLENAAFWGEVTARIRAHGYPQLADVNGAGLYRGLPGALIYVNAQLALRFARRGEDVEVARHLSLVHNSGFTRDAISNALRRTVRPLREQVRELCAAAESGATADPKGAAGVAHTLTESAGPLLSSLDQLLQGGDALQLVRDAAHDTVALATLACAKNFINATRDWDVSQDVLENALAVAGSEPARTEVNEWLEYVRREAYPEEKRKYLTPIESKVNVILASASYPHDKFQALRDALVPQLDGIKARKKEHSKIYRRSASIVAGAFRKIANDLRTHWPDKIALAVEAINLAIEYCYDTEISRLIKIEAAEIDAEVKIAPVKTLCLRTKRAAAEDPSKAYALCMSLFDGAKPLLATLTATLQAGDERYAQMHNLVAGTLLDCQNFYGSATKDWASCQRVLECALEVVAGRDLRHDIKTRLDSVIQLHNSQRIEQFTAPIISLCARMKAAALAAPELGDTYLERLLDESRPMLAAVEAVLPNGRPKHTDAHERVAQTALDCQSLYGSKTQNWTHCLELLARVRTLLLSARTLRDIDKQEETARFQRDSKEIAFFTSQITEVVESADTPVEKFLELRDEIRPMLKGLKERSGETSRVYPEVSDALAKALQTIARRLHVDARNYELSGEANQLALSVCRNAQMRSEINKQAIALQSHAVEMRKLTRDLQPVTEAPTRKFFAGTGFALRGKTGFDSLQLSYIATLYFVLFNIPLLALGRYRVSVAGSDKLAAHYFGRLKISVAERRRNAVVIVGSAASFISVLIFLIKYLL